MTRTKCVRECISPSCYREIYDFDEVLPKIISVQTVVQMSYRPTRSFLLFQLEEGEIDVRLISFKGCFMQRTGRSRN